MPISILMPALSPTMTEGTLSKWLVSEGSVVSPGDIIAEVETDKATMEVECIEEGTLAKILVEEGSENVPVNQLIGVLIEDEGERNKLESYIKNNTLDSKMNKKNEIIENLDEKIHDNVSSEDNLINKEISTNILEEVHEEQRTQKLELISNNITNKEKKVTISPLAKRMALKSNINIREVIGTGPKGRIIKKDIDSLIASKTSSISSLKKLDSFKNSKSIEIPVSNMRKTIASRLSEAKQNIPHFYLKTNINMDNILKTKEQLNIFSTKMMESDLKITLNDIVIKAVALALEHVPEVNRSWQNGNLIQYNHVDISVAVAVEDGLYTPVIRNASEKSLSKISKEIKILIEKARSGKLSPEDYNGGNITISNLGMYDIDEFTAIINPPQSGILAFGKIKKEVIVQDNNIEKANIMSCTLSGDHRVIDGASGAKLLKYLKHFLSYPNNMII